MDDAHILEDVRSSKAEVERQQQALESALARQKEIIAEPRRPARRDRAPPRRAPGAVRLRARGDRRTRAGGTSTPGSPRCPGPSAGRGDRATAGRRRPVRQGFAAHSRRAGAGACAESRSEPDAESLATAAGRARTPRRGAHRAPLPRRSLSLGRRVPVRLRLLWLHDVRLRKIGISLPHYVSWQYGYGRAVSRSQLAAGDLVFFNGLGHVGIYIGGRFVHAPHTGDVVKISSIWESWYRSTWVGARRL